MDARWTRLKDIFTAAQELDDAERERYVDRACEGDDELRTEVLSLLDSNAAAGDDFIEVPSIAVDDDPDPQRPRRLGDYEIIGEIASGGMGVVYRARHRRLGREVALKTVRSTVFASSSDVARFQREVRVVASIDHPHVVPVLEVGEDGGTHFFAMRLFDGGDLARPAVAFDRSPPAIARFSEKIASAVDAAHRLGVVHRDLKPANVLLDAQGEPHVGDFGLAKPLDDSAVLTLTGQIAGTASYMAPEQARGEEAGLTADVYSLGAILYELLTGRPPFHAASALETLRRVAEGEPEWPRALDRRIPRDLEAICMTCLEKDPARRYASAAELAADLRRFDDGEAVTARRISPLGRTWRWCRRHRMATAIGSLLVVLVVVTSVAVIGIERSRRASVEALWQSYLSEAGALRTSDDPGRATKGLEAIGRAARIRPHTALRDEAISFLAMTGLFDTRELDTGVRTADDVEPQALDDRLRIVAVTDAAGKVTVREIDPVAGVLRGAGRTVCATSDRPPTRLLLSPSGRWLAVFRPRRGNRPSEVEVVSLENPNAPHLTMAASRSTTFGFDARGERFAVAAERGIVRVHELATGDVSEFATADSAPGSAKGDREITCISLAPDGRRVAIAFRESACEIRIVPSGTTSDASRTARLDAARSVAADDLIWSPSERMLAIPCRDYGIDLVDVDSGGVVRRLVGHEGHVTDVRFDRDGVLLASCGLDEALIVWDAATGRELVRQVGVSAYQVRFSRDGRRLGRAVHPGGLRISSVTRSDVYRTFVGGLRFELSADARWLHCAHGPGGVSTWDAVSGRRLGTLPLPTRRVVSVPGGGYLTQVGRGLFLCPSRSVQEDGVERLRLGPPRYLIDAALRVDSISVSADGTEVAIALGQRDAVVIDLTTPDRILCVVRHPSVNQLSLSPDGRWLATGTWFGEDFRIWDVATGALVKSEPATIARVYFSPDGRWLVSSTGSAYTAWRVGSWERVWQVDREDDSRFAGKAAFSSSGSLAAFWITRRTVSLHDSATGRRLAVLRGTVDEFPALMRFSPAGDRLWIARGSGDAKILERWDLPRLRARLDEVGLDWDAPRLPEGTPTADAAQPAPIEIELDLGAYDGRTAAPPACVTPATLSPR